jgi:hypothetical protein
VNPHFRVERECAAPAPAPARNPGPARLLTLEWLSFWSPVSRVVDVRARAWQARVERRWGAFVMP